MLISDWSSYVCSSDLVFLGGFGQQYAEFLAAKPSQRIAGPLQAGAEPGDAPDHLVARRMAMGVVDPLEMIDVEQQQAGGPLMPFEQGDGAVPFDAGIGRASGRQRCGRTCRYRWAPDHKKKN